MSSKYETTFPIVLWPKNFIGVLMLLNFDLICVLLIELRITRFYATISTDITIKTMYVCMYDSKWLQKLTAVHTLWQP